jgi:putative ABC transport system permease protein
MFKNNLKIAVRNLLSRKGYTFLNILGLAIGMTCCLLIFEYVGYERSYDSSSPLSNQIVRLRMDSYQQGKLSWKSATVYPAFGPTMKNDFPEVENFCRLIDANMVLLNQEKNVKFNEEKGYYADPAFLQMFNVQFIKGDPVSALNAPYKIVLSENTAKKYFGNEDPIGKKLEYRDTRLSKILEVTGIFKEYPANSHLIIDHLVSYSTLGSIVKESGDTSNATETSWGWYDYYTYLQLKNGTNLKTFESKFPAFCDRYINNGEWQKTNNVRVEIHALPLKDIHLYSNYNQEAEVNGNGQSVSFLFLIAFFIIAIAWINYINLATARSLERAREVGVRKVLGALRWDLVGQFLVESILLNLIAFVIALVATYLLTPMFSELAGRTQSTGFSLTTTYWLLFAGIFLIGSLLSGLYPAFVLSGFQPVYVLKGLFKNTGRGLLLRKSLIVLQFSTSVILIAGTVIVYQQVNYMRNQQLGANISQTIVLDGAATVIDSIYKDVFQPFKSELLQQRGIKSVTASSSVIGKEIYWTSGIKRLAPASKDVTLYHLGIDYDFIPAYGMKLVAGRNFSADFKTDRKAVLLNESAVAALGFESPAQAIDNYVIRRDTLKVIGVVSDYHHQGLQKAIDPMIFLCVPNIRSFYSIKVESGNMQETVASIQKIWNQHFTADPFNYYLLDELYDGQYKANIQFGKIFGMFAFLAILVACFGLLGLSAYNVLQRTKEIGIRKVLGASVRQVLFILSKDFMVLVLVAFLVSIPLTWWVMNYWLKDFAFRINISWWVFGIAGLIAILIALLTISFQAIKAAIANPVKSLRTE